MKNRARTFRKNMTEAGNRMWYFLRDRRLNGYKFIREQPIGKYIADFVFGQKKMIIEIDGSQQANHYVIEYDLKRTIFLESQGYTVFRVWNCKVFENINGVLEA